MAHCFGAVYGPIGGAIAGTSGGSEAVSKEFAGSAERSHTQFSLLLPARTAVPWPEGLDALAERTSAYSQSLASFVYKRNPVEYWIVSRTRIDLVPARGTTSHLVQLWL